MVKFTCLCRNAYSALRMKADKEWFMVKLTYHTLFFNSLNSWHVVMDTMIEPLFWFVDHFVRYLGPAFVVLVVALTTSVVVIFYVCLLPHKYSESMGWTLYHLIFGHWLLANIAYNYFKAAFTDPGSPPMEVPEVVSICKKCIAPKPPRAHHCSVCNRCILKMDHHCPWLNNCVGHNNHRYFFLFCVYMWLGTVYVSFCAYPLFTEHFYGAEDPGLAGVFYPIYLAKMAWNKSKQMVTPMPGDLPGISPAGPSTPAPTRDTEGLYTHNAIIYEFMLCSAVTVALLLLIMWHCRLVTRAETSIEMHINSREASRMRDKGLVYKNPYSFGIKQNWINFLGITHGRKFWSHVLLPSSHKADGDGLKWKTSNPTYEDTIQLL